MSRLVVTLANEWFREKAIRLVREAKDHSRVEFKGPQRSDNQNAAMWAMLGDLSTDLRWYGKLLDPEEWKLVMLDALRRERRDEMKLVPNTDGTGFVNISGASSSDLSHEEMSYLLTIIRAFGDQQGVEWSTPKPKDNRPAPPVEVYEEHA